MALSLRKLPYCIIANKAVDKYVRMERGRYAALLSEIKRSGLQFATASELNPVMYAASAAAARSTTDKPLQLASEHLSTRQKIIQFVISAAAVVGGGGGNCATKKTTRGDGVRAARWETEGRKLSPRSGFALD